MVFFYNHVKLAFVVLNFVHCCKAHMSVCLFSGIQTTNVYYARMKVSYARTTTHVYIRVRACPSAVQVSGARFLLTSGTFILLRLFAKL